jgi:hypothetical protein
MKNIIELYWRSYIECVKLWRYIMDRSMPDKAIDVMDEAGAATI